MYFELLEPRRLRAVLTGEDLREYRLTFDEMDYREDRTQDALLGILEEARRDAGFSPEGDRLFVEIYPLGAGCVIYFSAGAEEPVPEPGAVVEPMVFTFADCEDMISGCVRLFRLYCHRIHKSALYYLSGQYRLILYPLDRADSDCAPDGPAAAFLCEYAHLSGRGAFPAAYVAEHGKPIAEENAVDRISYYLS